MTDKPDKCLDYAMNYIYRYPKTEKELKTQLLKKGFTDTEVETAITNLKNRQYLDDEYFAKLYIGSELSKKGKPLIVVKSKLIQKGIDKNIINRQLKLAMDDIDEGIGIRISKEIEKYKKHGMEGFDIIKKLLGKGYTLEQVKKVL